jgi:hypothetical protein
MNYKQQTNSDNPCKTNERQQLFLLESTHWLSGNFKEK